MLKSLFSYALFLLLAKVNAVFDADSKQNVALYWGQNSAGTQQSLGSYCESSDADIYLLSFLYRFPTIGLDFANACFETFSDGTLHCSQIAEDIKTCQSLGKKVFLSMGGASGAYGFADDNSARDFAQVLWNTFGEGSGSEKRPFDDAVLDGFDLDIENNNPTGYAALVDELRSLFPQGSKQYYISAAPQCPYPDASVGNAMQNADIDFAFIQFYNNYCNVDRMFNWDTWIEYAQTVSPNKNIKLYLGLPGAATAAGSGYISDLSLVKKTIQDISSSEYFGGIAMWDASQAFSNQVDGESYVAQIKNILEDNTQDSQATSTDVTSTLVPTSSSKNLNSGSTFSEASSTTSDTSTEPTRTTFSSAAQVTVSASTAASSSSTFLAASSSSSGGKTTLAPSEPTLTSTSDSSAQTRTLSPSFSSSAASSPAHDAAQQLNAQYAAGKYNGESSCTSGQIACASSGEFAICNFGSWVNMACSAGTTCYAYDDGSTVTTGCNFANLKSDYVD
ncbi:hypothetical protein HG535_0G02360 [Zygotorulaspora mrakii]|uniref:chitinase n=1 Tax=Zygotorulaspora mrakii TaxID=42260 RepID=A0A7H9B9E5_ZYGMR|nr:uncharacterized protein HG535_0G02360 [Zygotorulaspora mrakii]QLG74352.1 hypothetical protein HG535_0G02360 [Zygotorulaspora mrakii]